MKIHKPHYYATAEESRAPGYLARRFRKIEAQQKEKQEAAEKLKAESAAKVSTIKKRSGT